MRIRIYKFLSLILAAAIAAAGFSGILQISVQPVLAASGEIYSCTIVRSYSHPVTGEIEDVGGESSSVTGQGMVEGCIYDYGMLEVTDDGSCYLSVRLSLMDFTSNHSFWVQTWGSDGWSSPALGVTGSGSDTNGTTNDICIQLPSENAIVRCSMYVEPMGRDVVFYFYATDLKAGGSSEFTPVIVTEGSGSDSSNENSGASEASDESNAATAESNTVIDLSTPAASNSSGTTTAASSSDTGASAGAASTENKAEVNQNTEKIENSGSEAEAEDNAAKDTDSVVNEVQGLSLSTASEAEASDVSVTTSGYRPAGEQIMINIISIVISGVILMLIAAAIIYVFLKNRVRWFGNQEDDRMVYRDDTETTENADRKKEEDEV